MRVAEVVRLLERDGWRLVRTRSSHRQYKRASKPGLDTVAGKPGTEIPRGTLRSIMKQARLRGEAVRLRYTVILERGDDSWGAHVPDLPGCVAAGESREEALLLIREAIELHIQRLREDGSPVPLPRSEGEIVEVGAA